MQRKASSHQKLEEARDGVERGWPRGNEAELLAAGSMRE